MVWSLRPVVGEDVAEEGRVAVEEILSGARVVEEIAFVGAEQRVGILLERSTHRLERLTAHVDAHLHPPQKWRSHDTTRGGSVAERLACWTQAQKGVGSNRSRDAVG